MKELYYGPEALFVGFDKRDAITCSVPAPDPQDKPGDGDSDNKPDSDWSGLF